MSRRPHTKSRNGCMDCKRRHMKCDQTQPSCINCLTHHLKCSYLSQPRSQIGASTPSPASRPASSASPESSNAEHAGQSFSVNSDHMALLCHYFAELQKEALENHPLTHPHLQLAGEFMASSPFLTHQVLAVSALHLSITRPDKQRFYHNYGIGLQAEALSLFHGRLQQAGVENSIPTFLFAFYVGVFSLAETLRFRPDNLDAFLDNFIHCVSINRGVGLFKDNAWPLLRDKVLFPDRKANNVAKESPTTGCDELKQLVQRSGMNSTDSQVYIDTIDCLQRCFDNNEFIQSSFHPRNGLTGWPIMLTADFVEQLSKRRPEALAILAHYGVMLHRNRSLWVIADSGEYIVRGVTNMLGHAWAHWLRWPNSELRDEAVHQDGQSAQQSNV